MASTRVQQLHAQGERTRERLLDVARAAIAQAPETPLSAIARGAGVGIGTLYRHFPSREDLVFELYRHEVTHLADTAQELLGSAAPLDAFRLWLNAYADFVMTKAGLLGALRTGSTHGEFAREAYGPVTQAVQRLLDANAAAGTIQRGATPDDVLLAIDGIYGLDPDSDWRPRAARLFDLIISGLHHSGSQPRGETERPPTDRSMSVGPAQCQFPNSVVLSDHDDGDVTSRSHTW